MPEYIAQALDSQPPSFHRIERAGRLSLVAIVAAGVLITLPNLAGPWYSPARVGLLALGALYLAVFVYLGDAAERSRGKAGPVAYLALQLALATALFAIPAAQDTFGMTWLVLMPLVGHSVFLLGPAGVAATCLGAIALVTAHAAHVAGARVILEVLPGIGLAVLFVVLFANVTRMELVARARSDRLRDELEEAHRRLAEYSVQAAELAASRERNRLAREIHDSLGHHLTVVSVQLEAAELVLDRDPEDARRRIARVKELAREGLAEVRRSVGALRASPLDGRPLGAAIRGLFDAAGPLGEPGSPRAALRTEGEPRELPEATELTLYRAAQEGLTNARRHARASSVEVVLDYREPSCVRLTVSDDGVGAVDPHRGEGVSAGGFGLLGLRERVQLTGGRMDVRSRPGEGFVLGVEVPG